MRSIKFEIHPMSALLGALVVIVALGVFGAARVADLTRVAVVNPLTIRDAYNPRNAVVIAEGVPYTVPTSKLLVLTAVGDTINQNFIRLQIDGTLALSGSGMPAGNGGTMNPIPDGLTAPGGSLVELVGTSSPSSGTGRAWGYLVDA